MRVELEWSTQQNYLGKALEKINMMTNHEETPATENQFGMLKKI